jgi:hypothetical protein
METWLADSSDGAVTLVNMFMEKNVSFFQSPITKSVQLLNRAGRRWVLEIECHGNRNYGRQMDALLDRGLTFGMRDFERPAPYNGVITGVQLVGAHLRGNVTITVDGLPLSQTWLLAGDYIGIAGKLYRLTADVSADSGGEGTLSLNRGLLADAIDNAAVNTDAPTCEMLLKDNQQAARQVDGNRDYRYTLGFIESIATL